MQKNFILFLWPALLTGEHPPPTFVLPGDNRRKETETGYPTEAIANKEVSEMRDVFRHAARPWHKSPLGVTTCNRLRRACRM